MSHLPDEQRPHDKIKKVVSSKVLTWRVVLEVPTLTSKLKVSTQRVALKKYETKKVLVSCSDSKFPA